MKHLFNCFIISTCIVLSSCNETEQTSDKVTDASIATANSNAENFALKEKAFEKLDILEQFFGNENYLLVNGKDSSYLYFTRLGKNDFFTHSYKLLNGDSIKLSIDTILVNQQGKVQWNWQDKKLILQECFNGKALWQNDTTAGGDKVDFIKNNANQLSISFNNKQLPLTKTLPISLFLIRAKYDYQHHTHYAFDTTNFTKKH